jgi:poly(3-hydroxybutyrate) depolymerase
MRNVKLLGLAIFAAFLADVPAVVAQALPNLSSVRVGYNTRKETVKPQGELKTQIDEIDKAIQAATRLGRYGEVRRLYAKGTALLAGRTWTDADEFQAALVIRTDRLFVDSSMPYRVRLEQIFAPTIELTRPLTAIATLRPRTAAAPAGRGGGASAPPPAPAIELGKQDGVSRDLRESPFAMDLNVGTIADGPYTLAIEVRDQDRSLGTATLPIAVQKGLDARLQALESAAAKAPAAIQSDLRYPADYIRKINHGLIAGTSFNLATELAAAEATAAAAARTKKDPFVGRTGDFERHYLLTDANEIMPYRVYVPKSYTGSKTFPLIVALHGLGGTEDSMFDNYGGRIPALAEERGYIVVAPLGYRVDGFYGSGIVSGADPAARRRSELSEQDVMEVLRRTREQYKIDDSRIYLMGHSMGAIGTWAIAAKHPGIWAALGPISGTGTPAAVERMRHIPQIVVHGDNDPTVNVSGSRNMVAEMKKLGVEVQYIEVPGGNHSDIAVPNLPAMFDFFDAHRKSGTTSQ